MAESLPLLPRDDKLVNGRRRKGRPSKLSKLLPSETRDFFEIVRLTTGVKLTIATATHLLAYVTRLVAHRYFQGYSSGFIAGSRRMSISALRGERMPKWVRQSSSVVKQRWKDLQRNTRRKITKEAIRRIRRLSAHVNGGTIPKAAPQRVDVLGRIVNHDDIEFAALRKTVVVDADPNDALASAVVHTETGGGEECQELIQPKPVPRRP